MILGTKTIIERSGKDPLHGLRHGIKSATLLFLIPMAWSESVEAGAQVDLLGQETFAVEAELYMGAGVADSGEIANWMSFSDSGLKGQVEAGQELPGSEVLPGPSVRFKPKPILGAPPSLDPPPVPEPGTAVLSLLCLASLLVRRHRPV